MNNTAYSGRIQHRAKKDRESNFELLRIIAMLLVLVVHASFRALDAPSVSDVINNPLSSFLRFQSESVSIICVNVFILITGWFGINPRALRLCAFYFQVVFIGISIYLCLFLLGKVEPWGMSEWIRLLLCRRGLWFVGAYIVLYIISPILNSFVLNTNRKTFRTVLVAFFIIQTIYGFSSRWEFFCSGYSPLSFAGLYLLSRYIRIYSCKCFSFNKWCDISIFLCSTLFTSLASMILVGHAGQDAWLLYEYLSPTVIVGSVYFFLFFSKISFHSSFINWIAGSAFAVYLFHCDPLIFNEYYLATIRTYYINNSSLLFIFHTGILIITMFGLSIIIDRIRQYTWQRLLLKYRQIHVEK